jgi:3'-phosphoadenosine 5'-phosphosulfate sulfotransferase (PAPS reductase)/FAD synthetase
VNKDYEYWKKLYLAHSKTNSFKKNIQKSKDIISEFLNLGVKSYISWSCGKDSTAMMHLILSLNKDIKVVSEKDDMDFPEEKEYLNEMVKLYNIDIDVISPDVNLWDIIINHNIVEDIHSKGVDFSDKYFYNLLREYSEKNKYKGILLGLRAGESRGRLMNLKVHRYIYYNQNFKQVFCQPIAEWTAKDVFAYLFSNNIPILPVYFKTNFVNSPEDIRKSWILPGNRASEGNASWLRYYYPSIFKKLCIIHPELRSYT